MSDWYRVAYKFLQWREGWCKHPDGFAREHWQSDKNGVERSAAAIRARGGEAVVEIRTLKKAKGT